MKDRISGLYAVTPQTRESEWLYARVDAVLAGGARLVQYRSKDQDARLQRGQAARLLQLCHCRGALLIVNDDAVLAASLGADGVHLGREDMPLAAARAALGSARVIGISCYDSLDRAREAEREGADYVAFGSFFPSAVKPRAVRASADLLRAARRALRIPIVAIGGITADNGGILLEAGAHALAAISALFEAADSRAAAARFAALFRTRDETSPVG